MAHRHAAAAETHPDRMCDSCGRRFAWRAKWAKDWDSVRFCSDACRARGVGRADLALEDGIRTALSALPGRAALLSTDVEPGATDPEPARRAARRMANRGEVVLVQGGRIVDGSTARGVFGIRRAR